ncbi:lactate utilization protein C [Virgibacillus dakarensis]|uniref:Lactate utilization protein C n=1 Tax=Lentibacillus populi TaxID=1827502 RepID=A0A9W5U114_9BACI|nr:MULTISPECIES: lactate utilization protein C [Bacillaceae]MTW85991.1 lactate utilization protein C [Virgibacillus dakarensis]GGB58533.1 lactate utilization protein C [Lentibacillus populi]
MTIKNRDSFLDNLAGQLGRKRNTKGVERPKWSINPQHRVLKDATQDELVEVLETQCKEIHTDFISTDKKGLADALEEFIDKYHGKSIVSAGGPRINEFGLAQLYEKMAADGKDIHLWDEEKGEENKVFAEHADIGITFSDITLAESGTVTLFNDKYNGRSISLLPQSYIAIIPKSTIVPRMTQATEKIHQQHQNGQLVSSCVSFVTGPSNSADIEMKLIVGVHGPVAASYVVVEDA